MLTSCSKRLLLHDASASWVLRASHGGYNDSIRDISWSDDGKYLLQVNPKGLIEILSATDSEVRSLQHVPVRETWAASFHRDGHRNVAVGSKTGQVSIWDTKYKNTPKTFPAPAQQSAVNCLSFNAKNTNLAATMQNGETIIYGTTSNSPVLTIKVPRSRSISAMKFHHESRSILGLATDEGHMLLRDITTNKDKVFFKNAHSSPVSDFTYSLINRDVLLSCGYDKVVSVYDVRMETVVSNIETPYPLTSVAINLENQIALGSRKGVLLIYDLRDLETPLIVIDDHTDEIRRVSFQPAKKRVLPNELSLKEDNVQMVSSPKHNRSPIVARTPDLFLACDTPSPKTAPDSKPKFNEVEKADSFLLKLGLDKSTADESFCPKKSIDLSSVDRRHNTTDLKSQPWEEAIAKSSTPLAGKTVETFPTPTSYCDIGEPLENDFKKTLVEMQVNKRVSQQQLVDPNSSNNNEGLIRELGEELRDLIRISVADLAEDNRNYYLSLLMQMTKQKLLMEKQVSVMVTQLQSMQRTQDSLLEDNKRLAMEVELLKSTNIHHNNY